MFYNVGRIHQPARVTPAMAAGQGSRVWSIEEIVGLIARSVHRHVDVWSLTNQTIPTLCQRLSRWACRPYRKQQHNARVRDRNNVAVLALPDSQTLLTVDGFDRTEHHVEPTATFERDVPHTVPASY
jgi:hypothetical protein